MIFFNNNLVRIPRMRKVYLDVGAIRKSKVYIPTRLHNDKFTRASRKWKVYDAGKFLEITFLNMKVCNNYNFVQLYGLNCPQKMESLQ